MSMLAACWAVCLLPSVCTAAECVVQLMSCVCVLLCLRLQAAPAQLPIAGPRPPVAASTSASKDQLPQHAAAPEQAAVGAPHQLKSEVEAEPVSTTTWPGHSPLMHMCPHMPVPFI